MVEIEMKDRQGWESGVGIYGKYMYLTSTPLKTAKNKRNN